PQRSRLRSLEDGLHRILEAEPEAFPRERTAEAPERQHDGSPWRRRRERAGYGGGYATVNLQESPERVRPSGALPDAPLWPAAQDRGELHCKTVRSPGTEQRDAGRTSLGSTGDDVNAECERFPDGDRIAIEVVGTDKDVGVREYRKISGMRNFPHASDAVG